jgi:hypothetical protein
LREIKEAFALGVRTTKSEVSAGGTTMCLSFEGESKHSAMVSFLDDWARGLGRRNSWYISSLVMLGREMNELGLYEIK